MGLTQAPSRRSWQVFPLRKNQEALRIGFEKTTALNWQRRLRKQGYRQKCGIR